jgi:hypothetical protein
MCQKAGAEYPSSENLLWRQGEPGHLAEDGEPSSQVFEPLGKDEGCLSVDDSIKVKAEQSYKLFTSPQPDGMGGRSAGVWAISIAEVMEAKLTAWADPTPASGTLPANDAHAVIEFGELGRSQRKKIAQRFKLLAIKRGRQFPLPIQAAASENVADAASENVAASEAPPAAASSNSST